MVKDQNYIKEIVELARLSPSSHNTQPWQVSIRDNKMVVGYAKERQLMVGDPRQRELFLSLGSFIETSGQAASSLGYKMTCYYIGQDVKTIAELAFEKTANADKESGAAIRRRRSNRRPYLSRPLEPKALKSFRQLKSGSADLVIFTDKKSISLLAELTGQATRAAMGRTEFRQELADWVRHNWTHRADGMPAYVQGIPGPVSLIAGPMIRKNPKVAEDQAKKDTKRVSNSAAVALILAGKDSPAGWLDAGRLLQRLWLAAECQNVSAAAFSAAVVNDNTVKVMKDRLGLKSRPVAILRLGYAKGKRPKSSPRRSLADILN